TRRHRLCPRHLYNDRKMIDGTTYPETRYQLRGLPVPTTTNRQPGTRTTIQGITLTNDFDGTFTMESGGSVATFTPDGHVSIN
ncbi:hypothetical protein ACL1AV_12870, partial [Corynebacterium striatum]